MKKKAVEKKESCSTLKIWRIGNRSFLLLCFKIILSRKIQLYRRRRNLLFFRIIIVKSKSLKQNQILLYHFHNFSTPRRFWMINYGQGGIQQLWQNRNQPVCQELLETRVPTSNGNIWIDCQSFMTQYWEAKHFLAGSQNSWKNNCCCYLEDVNL